MPAIGFGMLWGGYTLIFWGWCKVMGFDITIGEIVVPKKFKGSWPPKLIQDGASPRSSTGSPGVAPGDHPGDMPYTYPHGGTSAAAPTTGTGGGFLQV